MKANFKFQMGVPAKCKITEFKGTIVGVVCFINGCIQYILQPKIEKEGSNFLPEAYSIDEQNIELLDGVAPVPFEHEFKFATGVEAQHRINGFKGIVTFAKLDLNKCERYVVEGKMNDKNEESKTTAFMQELALVSQGLNAPAEAPIEKKKTGCQPQREPSINRSF